MVEEPNEDRSVINLLIPQPKRLPLKVASFIDVNKQYGNTEVFNELNLLVERGQKIGLVGHNGAGKSTLLKMLAGVEKPTGGNIQLGENIAVSYTHLTLPTIYSV